MKLLYSSFILLVTLVVAVQNFKLQKDNSFAIPNTYCSPECEFEYFPNLNLQSRMWANFFLPLPTSEEDLNATCSKTTQFLVCSVAATVGCRKGRPPMVRLAQIEDGYGYLCEEGAQKFLDVLPCLSEHYKQEDIQTCVMQRKNKVPRGPDGDFCIELENYHNCAKENAMLKCGQDASDFMSTYVQKTHRQLKEMINCDKFIN